MMTKSKLDGKGKGIDLKNLNVANVFGGVVGGVGSIATGGLKMIGNKIPG